MMRDLGGALHRGPISLGLGSCVLPRGRFGDDKIWLDGLPETEASRKQPRAGYHVSWEGKRELHTVRGGSHGVWGWERPEPENRRGEPRIPGGQEGGRGGGIAGEED